MKLNLKEYYDFAVRTAQKAGKILLDHYQTDFRISYKDEGKSNLVTAVDHLAEKFIVGEIKKKFPTHYVLSEEGGDCNTKPSPFRWIIDPIDGTTNYAHGYSFFAISIALEINEQIVVGIVYAPYLDELFRAALGHGAFLNNRSIKVSDTNSLETALLCTGFREQNKSKGVNLSILKHFCSKAQGLRRSGSAAIDLAYTAAGRLDAYWEIGLKPWDIAAGKLLVEEAGGKITAIDGTPVILDGQNILASNGILHTEMIKNIRDAGKGGGSVGKKKIPLWS